MTDDFKNPKPSGKYTPPIGDYRRETTRRSSEGIPSTYADINNLRKGLEKLIREIDEYQKTLETRARQYSLTVTSEDTKLVTSNVAEWPIERLGAPKPYITYEFYKALRFRQTTAAAYIRKRYEEAARDVTGTSAIDLLDLTSLIREEALLIQGFLNAYIGNVNDVAEFRTIEQFQDWLLSAVSFTRQFRTFSAKGDTNPQFVLPTQIQRTTAEEAKQGQALFKLKLNAKNDVIERDVQFLKRNFSEYASTYYGQYLGPALKFRLNVSGSSLPIGSRINQVVNEASQGIDASLANALTDQMRRRILFEEKVSSAFAAIKERDTYRSYVTQLAAVGRELPVAGPTVMIPTSQPNEDEAEYFNEVEYQDDFVRDPFTPSHSELADLDANDHPQYLLRDGGQVTGNISMDPGVLIDGMRPSGHRHTGADGTPQIHGADIIGGTISDGVIDPTLKPPPPYNVRILSFDENIVPPGAVSIDAIIEWLGFERYTYEIHLSRIGDIPDVVE